VYSFYALIQSKSAENNAAEPDRHLRLLEQVSALGMDHIQFYIFMKDVGQEPYCSSKVASYDFFESECSKLGCQKLSCEGFIAVVKQFKQIRVNKELIEVKLAMRKLQIAEFGGDLSLLEKQDENAAEAS
jgi:hypothetical protein